MLAGSSGRSPRRGPRRRRARVEREVAEVEELQALVLVLERRRGRPRAGSCARPPGRSRTGCAPTRGASLGAASRAALPTSNSPTPRTSTTSIEWCATTARPDSETMVGCGTPSASQISMHARRRCRWRTPASCSSSTTRSWSASRRSRRRGRRRRRGSSSGAPILRELDVEAPRLAQRVLDGADRGDLAAEVEVEELEAVEQVVRASGTSIASTSSRAPRPNFERSPPEASQRPGAARRQPGADADARPHAGLLGDLGDERRARRTSRRRGSTVRPSFDASSAVSMYSSSL